MFDRLSILVLISILFLPYSVYSFGGTTHQRITEEVYQQSGTDLPWEELIKGSTYPDDVENDGGTYAGHFYNAEGNNTSPNALERMYIHFRKAVDEYKKKNKKKAAFELGQAMHYMEDMTCPVHTWGYAFNIIPSHLFIHAMYEDVLDKLPSYEFPRYIPEKGRLNQTDLKRNAVFRNQQVNQGSTSTLLKKRVKNESFKDALMRSFDPDALGDTTTGSAILDLILSFSMDKTGALAKKVIPEIDTTHDLDIAFLACCDLFYYFCKETGLISHFN